MGAFSTSTSLNIDVLGNLASNMLQVQNLIRGSAYLLGLLFAFKALYSLKAYGESRTMMSSSNNIKEPLIYLLVSAILLILPQALDVMLMTAFGTTSILSYTSSDGGGNSALSALFGSQNQASKSVATLIQTIGYVAFIRGWILVARSAGQGQQPGSMGKGLMHVMGGVLAINIVGTVQILNNTLYGG